MKKYLETVHSCFKRAYCDLISYEVVSNGGNVKLSSEYQLFYDDGQVRSVTELSMDGKQCKVHCFFWKEDTGDFITAVWRELDESWTMDELYEIAQRL